MSIRKGKTMRNFGLGRFRWGLTAQILLIFGVASLAGLSFLVWYFQNSILLIIPILIGGLNLLFLFFFLKRTLIDPIQELVDTAQKVVNGHINNKTIVARGGEIGELAKSLNYITGRLEREAQALKESYFNTVQALAAAIDAKDHYTKGHSDRVAEYSVAVAKDLGLSENQVEAIKAAAYLHDVGKIGIKEGILNKPRKLTSREFNWIKHHVALSAKIVKEANLPWDITSMVYHHHENYDGTGYPDGLKGSRIPMGSRIILAADAFDAMTSERAYRSAYTVDHAKSELIRLSGEQFDSEVVRSLLKVVEGEDYLLDNFIREVPPVPGIVIHEGNAFFICDPMGNVREDTEQGLFYQDTRFMSQYSLTLNDEAPVLLSSRQVDYYSSVHYLTNPTLAGIPRDGLLIERNFFVGDGLHEDLNVMNYSPDPVHLKIELKFDSDFADIFEVKRGLVFKKGAFSVEADPKIRTLTYTYTRKDFVRKLVVEFEEAFESRHGGQEIIFKTEIEPGRRWHTCIDYLTLTTSKKITPKYSCASFGLSSDERRRVLEKWVAPAPKIKTNWDAYSHAYERSLLDLGSLRMEGKAFGETDTVLAAGVPWYMTVFGRDTIITAYQALPLYPELAQGALRILAKYQGEKVNPVRAEEPGKIPHEIRSGELATLGEVPHRLYYGTVDATPLYLILLSEYYRWTGDESLVRELAPNALAALDWIEKYGDLNGDGYVEYFQKVGNGLANQGWKDSGDSIRFADGTLAVPPTALCEVQGYVYDAKLRMAELMPILGKPERAEELIREADALKKKFNEDFWMEKEGFFAEALDKDKRRVDSITSNPGHALWSGIVDKDKAARVAKRLLESDMFSGWGVRTLSSRSVGYNPLSYHNGSVWPHDNSLIAAGLARYGFVKEASRVIEGLIQASMYFPEHRLPELFCGFSRTRFDFPVEYPASCSPQAWSCGTILFFLRIMLGVSVSVPVKRIDIHPFFPSLVESLDVEKLNVNGDVLSVRLATGNGRVNVHVEDKPKGFEVVIG
jgi:putative nucleotidyltransferase with HDIG domain